MMLTVTIMAVTAMITVIIMLLLLVERQHSAAIARIMAATYCWSTIRRADFSQ